MTEDQEQTTQVTETGGVRTQGRVKWFNNKAGYGFITSSSGENGGEDVFVHHSALITESEQYKYLVAGEYVEFCRCETDDKDHKWQAGEVKGVRGGKLMCETRNDNRVVRGPGGPGGPSGRSDQRQGREGDVPVRRTRTFRADDSYGGRNETRYRGGGPRGAPRTLLDENGEVWELVRSRRPQTSRARKTNNTTDENA